MTNYIKKLKVFGIVCSLGALIGAWGCKTNYSDAPATVLPTQTIGQILQADTTYSILVEALTKTGLWSSFQSPGNLTLFAPNDNAFIGANAGIGSVSGVDAYAASNLAALTSLLKYHVLGASKGYGDFTVGDNVLSTLLGKKVYVTKNNDKVQGLYVNGLSIGIQAGRQATNGYIYPIGSLLTIPTMTIAQLAAADTALSTLVSILGKTILGPILVAASDSTQNLTVFAPSNAAFAAAKVRSTILNSDTIASVIEYHILPRRLFASDMIDSSSVQTLFAPGGKDSTLTVNFSGVPYSVKGYANKFSGQVTTANIIATNGVIHVVDSVLAPFKLK